MPVVTPASVPGYSYNPDPSVSGYTTGLAVMTQEGMSADLLPPASSPLSPPATDAYALDGNLALLNQLNTIPSEQAFQTFQELSGAGTYAPPAPAALTGLGGAFDQLNQLAGMTPAEYQYLNSLSATATSSGNSTSTASAVSAASPLGGLIDTTV